MYRKYNIIPVFIFDGKPPAEKKELLQARRNSRMESEKEYGVLKARLEELSDEEDKTDLIGELDNLKKKIIYITKTQIANVKAIVSAFGYSYYEARGEADEMCAKLALTNEVWACMSEDMDMFAYGCPRVLRYLSLVKNTIVIYDTLSILKTLNMTQTEFRQICVLSGTDYNVKCYDIIPHVEDSNIIEHYTLYDIMDLFQLYQYSNQYNVVSFYEWVITQNKKIHMNEIEMRAIENMFVIINENVDAYNIVIANGPLNRISLRPILEKDGFVFAM